MTNICPICGEPYTEPPAISRLDNTTLICSSCGIREAVGGLLKPDEVDKIVAKNKELYRSRSISYMDTLQRAKRMLSM